MPPELKLVVRLQDLDNRLAELAKEIATLPKHVAEIEKKLVSHERKLEVDRAALAANQKERKKCEGDIQLQEQKISKLKGQMIEAKTNEQYRAFQNEIAYAEGEIRKAEDTILEFMEQAEPLEANVKIAETELKQEQQHVESEKKHARERTGLSQKELAEQQEERKSIVGQMDPKLYEHYVRIRKKTKGTAIADATDGRCDACFIALRPQFFQDLRRGDQVMFCESCGRILTYNPAVDVAPDGNGLPAMLPISRFHR